MAAQVIDARKTRVCKGERYFVDTNVWFWFTYFAGKKIAIPGQPRSYQLEEYPRFLQRVIDSGGALCHCPLTLFELANVIENTELHIFQTESGNDGIGKKAFRSIDERRQRVLHEIDTAWRQINQISECLSLTLDETFANNSYHVMQRGAVDPSDAFFIHAIQSRRIDYVITDDRDFCAVGDLIVVTANDHALRNGM